MSEQMLKAIGKLDSDKNLYIVSVDGNTTREVLDQGALVLLIIHIQDLIIP